MVADTSTLWRSPVHSDRRAPLPAGAAEYLSQDNPVLADLRARYDTLGSPLANHSMWSGEHRPSDVDLRYFRGNNPYVWQCRDLREEAGRRHRRYAEYVRDMDERRLLDLAVEDGLFGCWSFQPPGFPLLSRDLLDSVNEMYFLHRTCDLLDRTRLTVVDIGAGYGRLAFRMARCVPGLERYLCLDAVPESTFLSEYYLRYRRVTATTAVVPLDALATVPARFSPDIAVNAHSFSEMPRSAIQAWVEWLSGTGTRILLVVPNDGERLLSTESDGTRVDALPVVTGAGYVPVHSEPVVRDRQVRQTSGLTDFFVLFELAR